MTAGPALLFDLVPALRRGPPWPSLGRWPTAIEPIDGLGRSCGLPSGELWIKRDDASAPEYGGNKIRTLEPLLGEALACGARVACATGAFGSNHAVATAWHAPRLGLQPDAVLFSQPPSATARDNVLALLALGVRPWIVPMLALPLAMLAARRRRPAREAGVFVMPPGGATPRGALGYVAAGLELAAQVRAAHAPRPRTIVLPVGSTCTTAGLIVGIALARARALGFEGDPPRIVAVRVTPWPVTARARILRLAGRTARALEAWGAGGALLDEVRRVGRAVAIDGRQLGAGYGRTTEAGLRARERFEACGLPPLDTTYSAKAGAALLERASSLPRPIFFWATKSSAPLPVPNPDIVHAAPRALRRFLDRCARCEPLLHPRGTAR
ncbi:MAG: pyridoxal-phosphate dependent enzyme [Myxococcota bacterium]|nr:pyridoxal-phosphate dependent enzyme [Myxococcota bacterium]MDW8361217.1 pyridoxal-phosphate dependent enzyme [Myxococcales bacterium]